MRRKGKKKKSLKKVTIQQTENVSEVLELNRNTLNDSCLVISDDSDVEIANHNPPTTSDIVFLDTDEVSISQNNKRVESNKEKRRCFPSVVDLTGSVSRETTFHRGISSAQRLRNENEDEVETSGIMIDDESNESNCSSNKNSENTVPTKVRRPRHCFPTLSDEATECDSTDKKCKIYTSQIQILQQKKDKLEKGLKILIDVMNEESSNDEPAINPKPGPSTATKIDIPCPTTEQKERRSSKRLCTIPKEKPRKISKRTKALYSNLDKLISEYKENQDVLLDNSFTEDPDTPPAPTIEQKKLRINIKWKAKILSFLLESNDPFSKLMPDLASKIEAPLSRICLILNGKLLCSSQTPTDVNIQLGSVVECIVVSDKNPASTTCNNALNMINVKVQSNIERQKLTISCNKVEPLQKVLEDFAKLKNLKTEQLSMKFDGDKIDVCETPGDVGIEDGDCLDIFVRS